MNQFACTCYRFLWSFLSFNMKIRYNSYFTCVVIVVYLTSFRFYKQKTRIYDKKKTFKKMKKKIHFFFKKRPKKLLSFYLFDLGILIVYKYNQIHYGFDLT